MRCSTSHHRRGPGHLSLAFTTSKETSHLGGQALAVGRDDRRAASSTAPAMRPANASSAPAAGQSLFFLQSEWWRSRAACGWFAWACMIREMGHVEHNDVWADTP
jgi:hypothetical protein